MAIMEFKLEHGLTIGDETHFDVAIRELESGDVIDAQMASEKVDKVHGELCVYTSNTLLGLELMRRQIESVGSHPGPLTIKELRKLHVDDFQLVQRKIKETDLALAQEIEKRAKR